MLHTLQSPEIAILEMIKTWSCSYCGIQYFEFSLIHHQSTNDFTVIKLFKIYFIYFDLKTNRFKWNLFELKEIKYWKYSIFNYFYFFLYLSGCSLVYYHHWQWNLGTGNIFSVFVLFYFPFVPWVFLVYLITGNIYL